MRRFLKNPTFDIESGVLLSHEGESWAEPVILCDRSLKNQASAAATSAGTTASNLGSQAQTEKSAILPGLEQEANHPTGYTPTEMNNQLVAGEQGAGGAVAGVTGEAGLHAARTRNSAGYGSVLDEAARDKTRALSSNALNVQNKSADLAQKKQQFAQGELGSLYGTDTSAMLHAMGLIPQDVQAGVAADKVGWVQNFTDIMNSLTGAAKAGAQIAGGGSGGGGGG